MSVYCAAETVGKDRIPRDSASTQGALCFHLCFSPQQHISTALLLKVQPKTHLHRHCMGDWLEKQNLGTQPRPTQPQANCKTVKVCGTLLLSS